MTSAVSSSKAEILHRLRDRYVSEGHQFVIGPSRQLVPSFLGDYEPDAIALRGGGGVMFEIKGPASSGAADQVEDVARKIGQHPDWTLEVVLATNFNGDQTLRRKDDFRPPSQKDVNSLRSEVDALVRERHNDAALSMGWALLEAVGRHALAREPSGLRGATVGWQLIEALSHGGLLEPDKLGVVRNLLGLRSAVAHAVPQRSATEQDIRSLLEIVDGLTAFEVA